MLGSNSMLRITLLIYVTNAQQCGVINDNQQRIQMQGPPGKRAEVDYEKVKQIVGEAVKAEIERGRTVETVHEAAKSEINRGQIMEIVDEAVKAGLASSATEMTKMQAELAKILSEIDEIKVHTEDLQKYDISIILEDIANDIMSGNDRNQSLQQLPKYLKAIPLTPNEVKTIAEKHESEKKYIHSIVLYYSAGMMDNGTGNASVEYKQQRVEDIKYVGTMMEEEERYFTVHKSWVILLMEELSDQIMHVTGTSYEYKVEYQAWCLRDIGFFFYFIGDYEIQFNKSKLCVDTMKELGERAKKYRIFAYCLENTGHGSYNLGKYKDAVKYFEKAVKAYKSATDYPSELDRQRDMSLFKKEFKDAKHQLSQD